MSTTRLRRAAGCCIAAAGACFALTVYCVFRFPTGEFPSRPWEVTVGAASVAAAWLFLIAAWWLDVASPTTASEE